MRRPLTAAEAGIYLGQALEPASPAYWTAESVELAGDVDVPSLEAAVQAVLRGAESLHGRYYADGAGVWCEPPEGAGPGDLDVARVDVSSAPDPEGAVRAWMQDDLGAAPDLGQGPLFRTAFVRTGAGRLHWYLRAHHIALDGFAYQLLMQSVAAQYSARTSGGAAPRIAAGSAPIAAIVEEERRYRQSPAYAADRAFWATELETHGAPPSFAPPGPSLRRVRRAGAVLPAAVIERYRAAATACRVDVASWLAAAVAGLLAGETGAKDVLLGFPLTGRFASVSASVPCMAMNIVPLSVRVSADGTPRGAAAAVKAELRRLRPHQRYRYEDLGRDRDVARMGRRLFGPIVNVLPFDAVNFHGLRAIRHRVAAGPVEDLAVVLATHGETASLELEANAGAYDDAGLHRLGAALHTALDRFSSGPDTPLRELFPARATARPSIVAGAPLLHPATDVVDLIAAVAAGDPGRTAIEQDGESPLRYGELVAWARGLAARLKRAGVGTESLCAVLLPRSASAIVAELAIAWAGGAFVPLDPAGPPVRIQLVLEGAAPTVVVTDARGAARVAEWCAGQQPVLVVLDRAAHDRPDEPAPSPSEFEAAAVSPAALAYVVYTSGSTGRPNGVMVERGALAHFVAAARERYGMTPGDRVLQFAPLQFDASIEEIYVTLAAGATLVLRTDAMIESLPRFLRDCERLALSVLDLPTAFWHELTFHLSPEIRLPPCVRLTIIGGEAALPERVGRWNAHASAGTVLMNTYGPTEATVVCLCAELAPGGEGSGPPPIGRPLPGLTAVIVDDALAVVPAGEAGELCVSGPALARGYLGAPDITRARFVRLPALPALADLGGEPRVYRTGDRARLSVTGDVIFLGRRDDEVKISGHRVDPAEVESALLALSGVVEAAVVLRDVPPGEKRLAAFVVATDTTDAGALRAALARRLPPPAIPSSFVFLDRLPRDPNGKVDRRTLKQREDEASEPALAGSGDVSSPLEREVLSAFTQVLGLPLSNPCTDFFALGGRSLQALQVVSRLSVALEREIPLSALFSCPTPRALAASIEAARALDDRSSLFTRPDPLAPLVLLARGQGAPLFCVHPADGLAWCYLGLSQSLRGVTIHGLQSPAMTNAALLDFEGTVLDYVERVRAVSPRGPYRLLGWSSGGGIAHAMAVELAVRGHRAEVFMLDAYPADIWVNTPEPTERDALVSMLDDLDASPFDESGDPIPMAELIAKLTAKGSSLSGFDEPALRHMSRVALHNMRAYRRAVHRRFDGEVVFFRASRRGPGAPDAGTWAPYAPDLRVVEVDAHHLGMCQPASLETVGRELARRFC